ncbi:helix-turn-helix transcriptional regulator [Pseudonocardia kujensis]|uniref:helix-turn-helix domain-containing protein n=1 Tax=Pseudonocardia kujensis TaxID=1128675 RepID=UPI001E426395|nr:helix-turn-helix transcriptional regulator [Pseudonocardia kujensis]MCE0765945.1 helix-turn-helix transcriptional regulator [Pseudonocardia kujensis]
MKRVVDYQWRLSELMARRGLHNSTDLAPLLRERGIDLSPSQVYRVVTQRPERVSLTLVAALCDIFDCGPDDLITVTATDARRTRRTSDGATAPNVVELNELRPLRARITRDD